MSSNKEYPDLDDLQNITYQAPAPFQIKYKKQWIQCNQLLRVVPKKRLVFVGEYNKKVVIIKLFIHPDRAKKHWLREGEGAELLSNKHILTPDLVVQDSTDEGIYFIIFAYIQGQSLAEFWQQQGQAAREEKIKQMLPIIEQHHHQGLAHQDLHYGNFFLEAKNSKIYTLDGEEVKASSAPLNQSERLDNMALFLAQTFDLSRSYCLECLDDYQALASLEINAQERNNFWQIIKRTQQQRIDQYLKKILRECTEVISVHNTQGYSLCRREYHSPAIQQLLDNPEKFFQHENSRYLKQGNTCTVKSVLIDNEAYVIKRYNPKGLLYEFMHFGQISRARKSWVNAHLLRFMGILTPEPVALIEHKLSMGQYYRYFISRQVTAPDSWTFFCDNSLSHYKIVADNLLSLLENLREYKITHGDLKGNNFLIQENKVWMLDLDAMKQHKTSQQFNEHWCRDKRRFLKNWDKKSCYSSWKDYFNDALSTDI